MRRQYTLLERQYMEEQGIRVRQLRHDSGYTQRQVGKLLRIPHSNIGYVERGKRFLLMHELIAISALFNVSPSYIISGGKLRRTLRTALERVTHGRLAGGDSTVQQQLPRTHE